MKRNTALLALVLIVAAPLFAQLTAKQRVYRDADRLAGLLHDVRVEVNMSPAMWRTIANEANVLANRIYANTTRSATAHRAARDLRMHVRLMREAALKGDAAGARHHAAEAMPFVVTILDWAS